MKKWLPCELHCHTLHSDGDFSVRELTETAKERQLSGICLTDHNTASGYEEAEKQKLIPVLKGIEYTTYHGHMLCLGSEESIDCFNISDIDSSMKFLGEKGGLIGIAHPFQLGTPICTGGRWDFQIKDFSLVNYMEIWSEGEALMTPANQRARKMWLSLLDKGFRITPTFGRDWHRSTNNKLKGACTFLLIDGEISPDKMKKAIKKGKSQLSLGIVMDIKTEKGETVGDEIKDGERQFTVTLNKERALLFSEEYILTPEKIKVISKKGKTVYEGNAEKKGFSLSIEKDSYYIFELWGKIDRKENQLLALTAPVYSK